MSDAGDPRDPGPEARGGRPPGAASRTVPRAGSPRRRVAERGVGLVEVLVALAILMFAVLATSEVQVAALVGARDAGFHFALDRLSDEMVETLRAHPADALGGEFDHAVGAAPEAGTPGAALATDWQGRVAEAIPGAGTGIDCTNQSCGVDDCTDRFCEVEIEWSENIDGTVRRQRFRTGTPL